MKALHRVGVGLEDVGNQERMIKEVMIRIESVPREDVASIRGKLDLAVEDIDSKYCHL